jgi:hypothetical protein
MECWSIGVVRFVAAAFGLSTDYFWKPRNMPADERDHVPTNHQSPITSHLSRPLPGPINERTRGQHNDQDGAFGSDLPIWRNPHKVQKSACEGQG